MVPFTLSSYNIHGISKYTPPSISHATRVHFISKYLGSHSFTFQTKVHRINIHTYKFYHSLLAIYSYIYKLRETGCHNSLPLKGTLSSMFYLLTCPVCIEVNKNVYACLMASYISHVASSGPKCFHCTLTYAMVQFLSGVSFLSSMH